MLNIDLLCLFPLLILAYILLGTLQTDDIAFGFDSFQEIIWKQSSKWVLECAPKDSGFLYDLFGDGVFGCSGVAYFDLEGYVVKDVLVDIVGGVAGEDG